jgi:hypothetical protein
MRVWALREGRERIGLRRKLKEVARERKWGVCVVNVRME